MDPSEELIQLRQHGDLMQSSLSRILAFMTKKGTPDPGYETRMAVLEGRDAINSWTETRRKS